MKRIYRNVDELIEAIKAAEALKLEWTAERREVPTPKETVTVFDLTFKEDYS